MFEILIAAIAMFVIFSIAYIVYKSIQFWYYKLVKGMTTEEIKQKWSIKDK